MSVRILQIRGKERHILFVEGYAVERYGLEEDVIRGQEQRDTECS